MQINDSQERPECFGVLDLVFPLGEDGLRQTPEVCLACDHKTACLKTAIDGGGGLAVESEKLDRAYRAGRISFFERWARKKSIHRRRARKKNKASQS